jgi:predicted RNA binding protein YcfA (HicA-like mRNA interferase family)
LTRFLQAIEKSAVSGVGSRAFCFGVGRLAEWFQSLTRRRLSVLEFARFVCKNTYEAFGDEMDSSRLIRMLLDDGWVLMRIKGSHHHFRHEQKIGRVTVVHPKKDLPIGTVRAALKSAGLLGRLYTS